jgi:hypothetical protein
VTMRGLLRRLGPRYGIGLGLLVIVAIVIAAAKLVGHGSPVPMVIDRTRTAAAATGPPNDGESTPQAPARPSTSPGAAAPLSVATKFAQAWLHHTGVTQTQWHAAVSAYASRALSAQLDGTDPADVPASRITGDVTQVDFSASYVQYIVPTDSGMLTLFLQSDGGRWSVTGIDWARP